MGVKNTEIGVCGPRVWMAGFIAREGTTVFMSCDFFSVVGVMEGGFAGNSGSIYSDTGRYNISVPGMFGGEQRARVGIVGVGW